MGGKKKSKKNQIEDTSPPVQENAPNEKLVDSSLVTENENLKKENELLRAENKELKEKLQKLPENINKDQNTKSRTSENVMKQKFETHWNSNLEKEDQDTDMAFGSRRKKEGQKMYMPSSSSGRRTNITVSGTSEYRDGNMAFSGRRVDYHAAGRYDDTRNSVDKTEVTASSRADDEDENTASGGRRTEAHDAAGRFYSDTRNSVHRYKAYDWKSTKGYDATGGFDGGTRNSFYRNQYENRSDKYGKRKDSPNFYKRDEKSKLKLCEIDGDLFSAPLNNSLAHCVAQDLRMGSGIAVQFRQDFKQVEELMAQRKKVGDVAILEDKGRYIYYLITKKFSIGKPTMLDLQSSLFQMREHMEKNAVMNLAIPRIGCGLDRLNWKDVRQMLFDVFADLDVTITVYNFTISSEEVETSQKKSGLYVTDKLMKLVDIYSDTLLLLFGSECGYVDSAMKELDEKYRFTNDYKMHSRKLGDIVEIRKVKEIICILIVKKDHTDFISYPDLSRCLLKVRKLFKAEQYYYLGFSAFMDNDDDLTVAKIVTLCKNIFNYMKSNLWICWPPELKNVYDEYFPNYTDKYDIRSKE